MRKAEGAWFHLKKARAPPKIAETRSATQERADKSIEEIILGMWHVDFCVPFACSN
jgi:hypothetical protein